MKFSASSSDLLKALQTVNGAVPTKHTLPILECILFEEDAGGLRLSATDLEISILQRVSVDVEASGSNRVAVPARVDVQVGDLLMRARAVALLSV